MPCDYKRTNVVPLSQKIGGNELGHNEPISLTLITYRGLEQTLEERIMDLDVNEVSQGY